jgi:two-component system chemotaxis sensor kinase CheA
MIYLKAFYSGAHVVIKVQDDGRGIDTEKIRKKAIEKEMLAPDAQPTDRELLDIVFLPGFSTAEKRYRCFRQRCWNGCG